MSETATATSAAGQSTAQTMVEAFAATVSKYPNDVALRTPGGKLEITWAEYAERARALAAGFAAFGVTKADTVAIMLTNRPEFHLVDTAAFHLGAIPFSMYNTLAPEQINYVLGSAGSRIVVTESQFLPALQQAIEGTAVERIFCVDGAPEGTSPLSALESAGQPDFDFTAATQSIDPADVVTIIYTSGTTGPPKGVELTHTNVLTQVAVSYELLPANNTDRIISYLPDAHIGNRVVAHYLPLAHGIQVTTLANPKEAVVVLPEVRPTFFFAVPQVWYKVKARIEQTVSTEPSPVKKKLATWAITTGRKVARLESDQKPVPRALKAQLALADKLVLSKIRQKMGLDACTVAASAAAAISPDALEFVLGLGIRCCEAWGMSETGGVATVNRPDAIRIGTVGTPAPGAELKLGDDGELLVRGPLVMKGYRNDPEKTAEAITPDGWLHTGDIATIDADGYVKIVDRKKELIVNAAGKNMSPANIEGVIRVSNPLLGGAAVIGTDRPYNVALLTLDPDMAAAYAQQHGLPDASPAALAKDPGVLAAVEQGIQAANAQLSRVEQIKKYTLLDTVWEPGGVEFTPTMKLKRKPIDAKYAAVIDALYT